NNSGGPAVAGIVTSAGVVYRAKAVVLTTGTFLKGRIIIGDESIPAGRSGEFPADNLSLSLARCGFRLGRLKTGTQPRVDGRSIDYSLARVQVGSQVPLFFSFAARNAYREGRMAAPTALSPIADLASQVPPPGGSWRQQMDCHVVHTSAETHDVIRTNLHRAPMYNGGITSAGPRYCPSIETKIIRFATKDSHQLFLEPEGWSTHEVYVQGANTSLPEDVQLAMLQTIPALRNAQIMRPGYAIEYDYLPGTQVFPTLETKLLANLFLAGQIIGTTGYEEAGALGILAGINASSKVLAREPVVLRRDQSYIGVLVDDLVTKEMDEPYRMHTSQAEFRLLLRQDNADARLAELGHRVGLLDDDRFAELLRRSRQVAEIVHSLEQAWIVPNAPTCQALARLNLQPPGNPLRVSEFLCRADVTVRTLQELGFVPTPLLDEVAREIETVVKYAGYVSRQQSEVKRLQRMEERIIPGDVDYWALEGLRSESRERLSLVRPRTIGQASRIAGVAPSDVSVLLVHLERNRRRVAAG
ncbi:MAG: tRNA uridine-5-carboxymethylaminomethyl modification enzyme MnmG/GidA, partial [Chloroflexota bacterium]